MAVTTTPVVPSDHIDFEVMGVFNDMLMVRFRLGDKHADTMISWDGVEDLTAVLTRMAFGVVMQIKAPPKPTFQQLLAQVGKQGHADVPVHVPVPIPPPVS